MSKSIDLRQFRYFLTLSEELHFGRAAQRLHISQPPLSRQIRQLENQLGIDLFLRTQTGVVLTKAGIAFLPEVKRTLAQAEKAIFIARKAREASGGQFMVGYTTVFDRSEIPDVLGTLRELFPDWQFTTEGKHSIKLVQDIKNGVMDGAFITLQTDALGLNVESIYNNPLVVALPAHHALARKRNIKLHDLCNEPFFWFDRCLNPGYYDYCFSYFEEANFKPNIVPEPTYHHMLLGAIAEGQGVALMSTSLQKIKREGVVFRPLHKMHNSLSMGLGIAYSEQNTSPVLHKFLQLIRQHVRNN